MIATSSHRVSDQTDPAINDQIARQTDMSINYLSAHPEQIDARLRELDEEWDIERMLEAGSATLTLAGLALSVLRGRKWLLLSVAVQGFFMQHALQGWCPPLPVLRHLGFRTQYEIERERCALKSLRNDPRTRAASPRPSEAAEI